MYKINKITFTEWFETERAKDPDNIFPPGMDAQTALNYLIDYLLDDFILMYPATGPQGNTEAVAAILEKYSKKYKKELKDYGF